MFIHSLRIVSCYLSFGDGVHDGDGAEWRQVVTAGMEVHLSQSESSRLKKWISSSLHKTFVNTY